MDTGDCILPYIHSEKETQNDVRKVYVKKRRKEHSTDTLEDKRICHICKKVVACDVQPVNVDKLLRYIPEIDFNSTKKPVICNDCVTSVSTHPNSLNNCLDVNDEIEDVLDDKAIESIQFEDVKIKCEENYSNLKDEPVECTSESSDTNSLTNCLNVKEEIKDICEATAIESPSGIKHEYIESKSEKNYSCAPLPNLNDESVGNTNKCEPKYPTTANKLVLKRERKRKESKHKDSPESQIYKCDSCDYEADLIRNLTRHQLRHKNMSESEMYKCDSCSYKTVYKHHFKQHQLRHKNIAGDQMYQCDSCSYKAVRKCYLVRHLLRHKNISEEQLYRCDSCDYKTAQKKYLREHQLRHKHIPEEQLYTCDLCDYKSLQKKCITQHQLKHKHVSVEQIDIKDEPVECSYTDSLSCLNLKEEIKDICEGNATEGSFDVKCEDVGINSEDNYSSSLLPNFKDEPVDSTNECEPEYAKTTSNVMLMRESKRDESKDKSYPLNRKDSPKNKIYKCNSCDYENHRKRNLSRHLLRHKNIPDEQIFKCDSCDYKTIYKPYFTQHQLRHKGRFDKHIYKCDFCSYKTIHKSCIAQHQLKHKDIPEEEMYKCDSCNYKSANKSHFKIHQQRHKNIPDEQKYKCDSCDYKTNQKRYLTQHQLKHKDIPEEQMYLCYYCDYKTAQRGCLVRHLVKHKNITEEQMYKCDLCHYKTPQKYYLRAHQLRHKSIPEKQM